MTRNKSYKDWQRKS